MLRLRRYWTNCIRADIAELYQELDLQEAIYLYLLMDGEKAADVLMELDEEDRHKLLKELPND